MKHIKYFLTAAATCLVLLDTSAVAQQFNFAYRVTDSRINVFDDGKDTRIQLPEGTLVPAVFTLKTQGQKLLDLKRDGTFLVADGLHQSLTLVWANGREARVSFTGNSDPDRLGVAVAMGSAQPAQVFGTASSPVQAHAPSPQNREQQADRLRQLIGSAQSVPALPTVETGRNSASAAPASLPEASNRHTPAQPLVALSELATSSDEATRSHEKPVSAPTANWEITKADQTISTALNRWAASAGWQLAWQAPRDLPAFRVSYGGDFEDAVESLMRDSQNSEYPLHACVYDNKVVRVLHITQTCSR